MAINLGGLQISKAFLGNSEAISAYLGDLLVFSSNDATSFITTWRTTAANETITIPTHPLFTYNYDISTSDGQSFTGITGDKAITFATAGDYDVSINIDNGGAFPSIYFNNNEDKSKIIDIKQWGAIVWRTMEKAFSGCSNLTGSYTDVANTVNVTNMSNMFNNASSFNQPLSFNTSSVTNITSMFYNASSFNQPLNFNTSSVTNITSMFQNATSFNSALTFNDTSSVKS